MDQQDIDEFKDAVKATAVAGPIPPEDYLSSGCTLIDLACSGTLHGALAKGYYFWMVGDSSSGKTFITLNCLAEAARNKHFDGYDLIYNNVEKGALMDIEKFYGKKLAARLKAPKYDKEGNPQFPRYIEEFYFDLKDRIQAVKDKKAPPFIELLDSIDALDSIQAEDTFQEQKTAFEKGRDLPGSYGDGKAKITSQNIRSVVADMYDTKCILIILSQTRDNIAAKTMFDPKTVSAGGRALKFYASWQLWSTIGAKETREVNGKPRQIGINAKIAIKKNRLTGKEWNVEVPIYWSSGIDDTGAMVDFLIEEKHWSKGKLECPEFGFTGSRDKLIKHIEENNHERQLKVLVYEVWKGIEEKCHVHRKARYE